MGCSSSSPGHSAKSEEIIKDASSGSIGNLSSNPSSNSLAPASLLQTLGDMGSKQNVLASATFAAQLQRLMQEHPYLQPGQSRHPHPLHCWVEKCHKAFRTGQFHEAQEYVRRVARGLEIENRTIQEAFLRFDIDGSGNLDAVEFRHMCAYLGWGDEEADMMLVDVDGDGKITLIDFTAFIGAMGGVQQLFEKRRLRITTSRKDVCDFAGLSVGSRVRAHFYVQGQKSQNWKEAQVLAVGVERKSPFGPSTLGVLLEFGFGGGKGRTWRAKQVIPPSWVLSGVEDATVAAALREVGILDDQQGYWASLLPDSEMQAVERCVPCQRTALALVRSQSTASHEKALPVVRKKFADLGFGERELQAVFGWIQDLAPIVVHIHLDRMGQFMERDEYYRNQFETKTSCGALDSENNTRKRWEKELFGGAYDQSKPFERCKYGALNIMNDYRGVVSARGYGDSYLVLKDARLRCTFASTDSGGLAGSRLAVLDKYAHVLKEYSDIELRSVVGVAMAALSTDKGSVRSAGAGGKLQLLRGGTEDPTKEWVTCGIPGLAQKAGRLYFEVKLFEGCYAPQVGLVSTEFVKTPFVSSAQGVGDDEHGWGVDGQNCARWHAGQPLAWATTWPSNAPTSSGPDGASRSLKEDIIVGVAVNFDKRTIWFSLNGAWDGEAGFEPSTFPAGTSMFPAVSVKGRAGINLGPNFQHSPPSFDGGYTPWPGSAGGTFRLDCPHLGNSEVLRIYKEVQIHGELSLKRNVQRLVAADKYRKKLKTQRSYAVRVAGTDSLSGTYHRVGAHGGRPLYRLADKKCIIYWNNEKKLWCIGEKEDYTSSKCTAPEDPMLPNEPPHTGWALPDIEYGVIDAGLFGKKMLEKGFAAADVRRVTDVLTVKGEHGWTGWFAGKDLLYNTLKGRKLENEWKQLKDPPCSWEDVWDETVSNMEVRLLEEAGLGDCKVVQSPQHPYDARSHTWREEVQILDCLGLKVYFSTRSCTLDQNATLSIFAGGLHRRNAGVGSRVEVTPMGSTSKVWGTVCGGGAGGRSWTVRIDQRHQKKSNENETEQKVGTEVDWPKVGTQLEAKSATSGMWYHAQVKEIETEIDWQDGQQKPTFFVVEWTDGSITDVRKAPNEIRRKQADRDDHRDLEDVQRYAKVAAGSKLATAVCMESPTELKAVYGGGASGSKVGDEISMFKLDRSSPLAPITVAGFTGSSGPAGAAGVAVGWYLDISATFKGPSKTKLANLFNGIGGVTVPEGKTPTVKLIDRLLDEIFNDLDCSVEKLNGPFRELSGVTLFFRDSCSPKQVTLLPEAVANYGTGQKVGSEIRSWTKDGSKLRPTSFVACGPAQTSGVRSDWYLDISATLGPDNPGKAPGISSDDLLEDPDKLLSMSGVSLIFTQPNPQKSNMFSVSGPYLLKEWTPEDLPGDVAEFEFKTDGDGADFPEKRWGIFGVVRDAEKPAPADGVVDDLAEKWVQVLSLADGQEENLSLERDGWDEERLRALCARHSWEFEWMTEDGERTRRMHELGVADFGDKSKAEFAETADFMQRHSISRSEVDDASDTASVPDTLPDGFTEMRTPTGAGSGHPGAKTGHDDSGGSLLRRAVDRVKRGSKGA